MAPYKPRRVVMSSFWEDMWGGILDRSGAVKIDMAIDGSSLCTLIFSVVRPSEGERTVARAPPHVVGIRPWKAQESGVLAARQRLRCRRHKSCRWARSIFTEPQKRWRKSESEGDIWHHSGSMSPIHSTPLGLPACFPPRSIAALHAFHNFLSCTWS